MMVAEGQHPVDELLRAYAGDPQFDSFDRAHIEERLLAAIEDEKQARSAERPGRFGGRTGIVAWATVVAVVIVGVAVIVQTARITPATAALEEIARVAETINPLRVSDSEFIYTRSEIEALSAVQRDGLNDVAYNKDQLVYLLSSTRETWFGSSDTVQIRTTVHDTRFFNEADEDVYREAGLAERDRVGQSETITVSQPVTDEWPIDPDRLDQTIRQRMVTDRGLPETVEYLEVALNIIREGYIPRELRASTLRLIAGLDGLRHAPADSSDGPAAFFIGYNDRGVRTRLTFHIDGQGYLRFEERLNLEADTDLAVPAQTAVFQANYAVPTVTHNLPAR